MIKIINKKNLKNKTSVRTQIIIFGDTIFDKNDLINIFKNKIRFKTNDLTFEIIKYPINRNDKL